MVDLTRPYTSASFPGMSDAPVSPEEDARFLAICRYEIEADPVIRQEGRDAHEAGLAFHEAPYRFDTVAGLCWRLGWNDRALEQNDADR